MSDPSLLQIIYEIFNNEDEEEIYIESEEEDEEEYDPEYSDAICNLTPKEFTGYLQYIVNTKIIKTNTIKNEKYEYLFKLLYPNYKDSRG